MRRKQLFNSVNSAPFTVCVLHYALVELSGGEQRPLSCRYYTEGASALSILPSTLCEKHSDMIHFMFTDRGVTKF